MVTWQRATRVTPQLRRRRSATGLSGAGNSGRVSEDLGCALPTNPQATPADYPDGIGLCSRIQITQLAGDGRPVARIHRRSGLGAQRTGHLQHHPARGVHGGIRRHAGSPNRIGAATRCRASRRWPYVGAEAVALLPSGCWSVRCHGLTRSSTRRHRRCGGLRESVERAFGGGYQRVHQRHRRVVRLQVRSSGWTLYWHGHGRRDFAQPALGFLTSVHSLPANIRRCVIGC